MHLLQRIHSPPFQIFGCLRLCGVPLIRKRRKQQYVPVAAISNNDTNVRWQRAPWSCATAIRHQNCHHNSSVAPGGIVGTQGANPPFRCSAIEHASYRCLGCPFGISFRWNWVAVLPMGTTKVDVQINKDRRDALTKLNEHLTFRP
jgi:hypothetical protein